MPMGGPSAGRTVWTSDWIVQLCPVPQIMLTHGLLAVAVAACVNDESAANHACTYDEGDGALVEAYPVV